MKNFEEWNTRKSKLIVLCGSMINMDKMNIIRDELVTKGYNVIAPELSEEEIKSGTKTFIDIINEKGGIENIPVNDDIWKIKTDTMRDYLKYIEQSDAVLICNYTKGIEIDKIGDNSYFEMSIAFYLKKKIYVLNGPPYKSSKCEEVIAMQSTFLYGDLNKLFI